MQNFLVKRDCEDTDERAQGNQGCGKNDECECVHGNSLTGYDSGPTRSDLEGPNMR